MPDTGPLPDAQPPRLTREMVIEVTGCPQCNSPKGWRCILRGLSPKIEPHRARYLAAREVLGLWSKRQPLRTDSAYVDALEDRA